MQGRRTIIIPAVVLLCSIGAAARAQTSSNLKYRTARKEALPVTNGQPNLRSYTYIKDVHE